LVRWGIKKARLVCLLAVLAVVVAPASAAAPKLADLAVGTLTPAGGTAAAGTKVSIVAKVSNGGRGGAGASQLAVYLGSGSKHSRSDVKLTGSLKVPALKPHHGATVRGKLTVPAGSRAGSYRLIACADAGAKVKEANEANNCRAGSAAFQVGSAGSGNTQPTPSGSVPAGSGGGPGSGTPPSEPPHEEPTPPGLPGSDDPVPPPPAPPQASALPVGEQAPFGESTSFLFEGPGHVQTGVADDTIEPGRAGVLRGRVLGAEGSPLPSVTVTVADHPELGQTITRADGRYDLAVNAGGLLTLHFERPTFLSVDREVDPQLRDYESVEDVVLRHFDAAVTPIASNAAGVQIAQSSTTSDESGGRRATLIFMPGTAATMRLPGGATQPLGSMHVRATEYTVGVRGPESMPGDLPPSSAYTYAADYSVDEAVEAGATRVEFNQPVPIYTDNFIDMPVGTVVPLGSYDANSGEWVPESNGRVVKITAIAGGKAELDVDGDGNAESPATLAGLGITDQELTALGGIYPAGKELWRIAVTHFSPWDQNWPYGPPDGSEPPKPPRPPHPNDPRDPKNPEPPCEAETGSAVDCDSQALREALPIAGTPFMLDYTSARSSARSVRDVEIPITGASVPAPLKRIELDVQVAGQAEHTEYQPQTSLTHIFHWNGLDAYGRPVVGSTQGGATITYVYDAAYRNPAQLSEAFSRYGEALSGVPARKEVKITQHTDFTVRGRPVPPPAFLGGWTVSVHHSLDPVSKVVELGSGEDAAPPVQDVSRLFSSPTEGVTYPDAHRVKGAAWQPDGSVWFLDERYASSENQYTMLVRRVAPDGTISTLATLPKPPPGQLFAGLSGIASAPNGDAWVLAPTSSSSNGPLWKLAQDGTLTQVTAGNQNSKQTPTPNGGDGLPASQVLLDSPEAIDSTPDGTVYIGNLDRGIQRINAKGVLETVYTRGVGPGAGNFGTDTFAVGPDSSLYVVHIIPNSRVIDRVFPSGKVERIVGGGANSCCSTGQIATSVKYDYYGPVDVGDDGEVIFNDGHYLDTLRGDGSIQRLAGRLGEGGFDVSDGAGALFTDVTNTSAFQMDIGPDGRIVLATSNAGLRTVEPGISGFSLSGYTVPSRDGRELYRFDSSGRHTETLDALTGVPIWRFAYDSAGRLATITDRDDRTTTIERGAGGAPTAIVAPTGERTTLSLDAEGNLATVQRPGLPATQLGYEPGGLLSEETDAGGGTHTFAYDSDGLVASDTDPDGVTTTVSSSQGLSDREVALTSPLGHKTTFVNGGDAASGWTRTVTSPSGAQTLTKIAPDSTVTATLDDGRTSTVTQAPDPRFGSLAPFPGDIAIKEPSGLTFHLARTRATTLTNPKDPFSVNELEDRFRLGSQPLATRKYAGATRALTVTDEAGKRAVEKFDAKGHVTSLQEDAAEATRTATVDGRGRVSRVEEGNQSVEYTYDGHDRLATSTDGLGHKTSYEYDAAGRLTSVETPAGESYGYEHDGIDRLAKLTLPSGASARLTYTPAGRQQSFLPPGSGAGYRSAYDADGLPKTTTLPAGRKIEIGRDVGGRVSSIAYPEANVGVGYVGNDLRVSSLTRTPTGGGTAEGLAMGYDGDLLTSAQWSGPATGRYDYTYDGDLRLSQAKVSSGVASYTGAIGRDGAGRVTTQGPFTMTRSGPQGAISSIAGGPLAVTQAWDPLGRLESRTDGVNGANAYKIEIGHDAGGRLTQKVETIGGTPHTFTYAYDADGRLTDVSRDGALTEHYAYDADGNRTTRQVEGTPTTAATYDANGLITGLGATAYTTDQDGFVVGRGGSSFAYSARGEMTSATVGGVTETYAYDGWGRLVARTVSGQTWRYLYGNTEQQLQVTAAIEPDGTLDVFDYTDTGYLFSVLRGASRYYVSADQVGSPRVVSDAAGAVVKSVSYSAFGEVLSDSAPAFELPIGYAGGIVDPFAGLVHMGVRAYDPASGRFMSRDPLGLAGGAAGLFSYAGGDPIQYSDPTGFGSGSLSLCDGVCVGTKFAITDKGLSACVEFGVGVGNDVEISPMGGLDESKFYTKASASAGLGPLAGAELGYEASTDGRCQKRQLGLKVCAVGACVDSSDGIKVDPNKSLEALTKANHAGLEAKAALGVCQQLLF
jgi:RHS repeat-associated protein